MLARAKPIRMTFPLVNSNGRQVPTSEITSSDVQQNTLGRSCIQEDLTSTSAYGSILQWCVIEKSLTDCKRTHRLIVKDRLEGDVYLGSLLTHLYCECGDIADAEILFQGMQQPNVFSWNFMIRTYAHHGKRSEAIQMFERMDQKGVMPDKVTFISMLSVCASRADLLRGKWMHTIIICRGFQSDVIVATALMGMYGKCGSVQNAQTIFENMPTRNIVSWNAMIAAHVQNGQSKDALRFFAQMQQNGFIPNKVTFVSLIDACATLVLLGEGERMHNCIVEHGFQSDIVLWNALINMYGKCGSVEHARRIFDTLPERNIVSWTSVIAAYAEHGQDVEVFQLFNRMQSEGIMPNNVCIITALSGLGETEGKWIHACIVATEFETDLFIGNALISMYGKCGNLEHACNTFDKMPERDTISWNAMIGVSTQDGSCKDACQLFHQMQQESLMPNKVTLVSILDACSSQAAVVDGKRFHACIVGSGFELDLVLGTALLNLYGKSGNLWDALRIFANMPERNLISWNAMMAVYAQHGQGRSALTLFDQMKQEGVVPNKVTFVSVLSACSHSGLVDEACNCFSSMTQEHGVSPIVDHYNCIVDLLGRAGRLHEAEYLVYNMPMNPTAASLMTLLASYRYLVNVGSGERAAMHGIDLGPDSAAPYVMLSNIYAAAETCSNGILEKITRV